MNVPLCQNQEPCRGNKFVSAPQDQIFCSTEMAPAPNRNSSLKCLQKNEQEPLLQSLGNSVVVPPSCHPQQHNERKDHSGHVVPLSRGDNQQCSILPPLNNACCPARRKFSHELNFGADPFWQKNECFHENMQGLRAREVRCLDRRKCANGASSRGGPPNPAKGFVLPPFPHFPQLDEAGLRHKPPARHFARHHSDESLHGSSHREIYSSRIHSSFDELSSANRSPSLSSSDESFSRTDVSRTEAESPSPQNTPSLYEDQLKYLCGDSDLLDNLALNFKDVLFPPDEDSTDAKVSASEAAMMRMNNLNSNHVLSPAWRATDDLDSPRPFKKRADDLFIPKFSPHIIQDRAKKNKARVAESKTLPESSHGHLSSGGHARKAELGPRHSLAEERLANSGKTGGAEPISHLHSLEKSPRESGVLTPDSVIMMPRNRSLTREDYLSNSSQQRQTSPVHLAAPADADDSVDGSSSIDSCPCKPRKATKKEWLEMEPIIDATPLRRNRMGSLDRLESRSGSQSAAEDNVVDGYNSLQKLIKLQEQRLNTDCGDFASEKLGLHFDPSKNHKILQLKPLFGGSVGTQEQKDEPGTKHQ